MKITEALTNKDLRRVTDAGTRLTVPQGWSLIWEKTPADKAYLVISGTVSIQRDHVEIARLGAGDVVGETAIVNHRLRNASVVAATPLEVIHFTDEAVTELCATVPAFKQALENAASDRLVRN